MLMLWRVAWRNLWRQGRRSMLTVSAMAVGVALCMAMFALIDGMYTRMFDVMVSQALGHVQVHHQAWPADQQLYDTVPEVDALLAAIDADPGVKAATVRLSCFGLAAGDKTSAGARFMGVDPDREDQVTQLKRRVVRGSYLDAAKPNGVLIGAGLAEELEVEPGGEIVMISQGADGSIANALFDVVGVVETGSTMLDRAGVWTPLPALQSTLVLPNQVHELLILSDDLDTLPALKGRVEAAGGDQLMVRTWQEANPQAALLIGSQTTSKTLILFVVFSVSALGVLNTMMMNVFERTRELGVLKAIGLSPAKMMALVLLEAAQLGVLASAVGVGLGLLIDLYLVKVGVAMSKSGEPMSFGGVSFDPIMRGEVRVEGIVITVVFVFFVSIVAAVWPGLRAARLQPVDAMRQR